MNNNPDTWSRITMYSMFAGTYSFNDNDCCSLMIPLFDDIEKCFLYINRRGKRLHEYHSYDFDEVIVTTFSDRLNTTLHLQLKNNTGNKNYYGFYNIFVLDLECAEKLENFHKLNEKEQVELILMNKHFIDFVDNPTENALAAHAMKYKL